MGICKVEGCYSKTCRSPITNYPLSVCSKHERAERSGRVNKCNSSRDLHNYWRKGKCENCGIGPTEIFERSFASQTTKTFSWREKILLGTQVGLTGDHIKQKDFVGHNHPTNIQTLCYPCHKAKTLLNGDHKQR